MFAIYHAVHTIAFVQIKDETSTAPSLRTVPMGAHITVNGLDLKLWMMHPTCVVRGLIVHEGKTSSSWVMY
jgi:hypothetical protein